jgi:hypothetical protein
MNTMHHSMTGSYARWAVLWIGKNGWVVKEFENDFSGSVALYVKVKAAGKRGATLLCRNVGFPPPAEYPMDKYNLKGAVWCPYCRELRKFKKTNGFYVDDIYYPQVNMQCPVCGITTENYYVQKYNPAYGGHTNGQQQGRTGRTSTTGRSTTRRGPSSGGSKLTDAQRAAKRERAARRRAARR